jgi:hypothetical protein
MFYNYEKWPFETGSLYLIWTNGYVKEKSGARDPDQASPDFDGNCAYLQQEA